MHEVIGHASGRVSDALTGRPQDALKEHYSAREEGRADLVALYYMPDPKLAEAFGAHGIRCTDPALLDEAIKEMIETPKAVVFDCVVDHTENCLPMIPSGKAHNEIILPDAAEDAPQPGVKS